MGSLLNQINSLADSNTTVLITGPTGSGKGWIAEKLHATGCWEKAPFVKIDCTILKDGTIEQECLEAYTLEVDGAEPGRGARTSRCCLLLDEVAEIPLPFQGRLLRLLDEKQLRLMDGTDPLTIDLRIIATTNQDLMDKVEVGLYRSDLYYRLRGVEIKASPLQERPGDIGQLVEDLIDLFNSSFHRQVKGVSCRAMQILQDYSWPGNIRELKHVVEQAFFACEDDVICTRHLREDLREMSGRLEAEKIAAALKRSGGNKSLAAKFLGISRRTIYRKIAQHGIAATDHAYE